MRFIYCAIIFAVAVRGDIIEITDGRVEGTTLVARNGRLFKAYRGIPYAKPPVGNLRFQPPVPIQKWKGIFNASGTPPKCPQVPSGTDDYVGVEDCLYVNVYTPQNIKPGSNLPVIFYIFGGGFQDSGPPDLGPEYLLSRDIVLVMVSYRIGVLGFLSTGDSIIPGNFGLKDQTLAMKWTKKNIYEFGGDPNKVTLHGSSSGAMCAHLHTLSKLSRGYFSQVILQSGFGTAHHSFYTKNTAKGLTTVFAREVNCSSKSSQKLLRCLLGKDAEYLVRTAAKSKVSNLQSQAVFIPTVEDSYVENAFLTEVPITATYHSSKQPWLLGITTGEGASDVSAYFANTQKLQEVTTINSALILPIVTNFLWSAKPSHEDYIAQAIKTHFFGEEGISPATDEAFVEVLTGAHFGMNMLGTLQKYAGMKYAYLYDYKGQWSSQDSAGYGKYLGVSHSDEVPLLFKEEGKVFSDEDHDFGDEMITRWINFAYSGNPNEPFPINTSVFGAWSPVMTRRLEFLRIKKNGSMEADYFREKYEFWLKLPIYSGTL